MENKPEVTLCCTGLRNLFGSRGERGLSVLIKDDGGRRFFVLQTNALSAADYGKMLTEKVRLPFDFNLRLQRAIVFCPYCGTDLRVWIERNPEQSALGADISRPFLMPG